jgi:hypothetical protein
LVRLEGKTILFIRNERAVLSRARVLFRRTRNLKVAGERAVLSS